MDYNFNDDDTPNLRETMAKQQNNRLFRAECAKLCKVHPKSWDNYVRHGYVVADGTTPPNKRWFFLSTVLKFKKKLAKNRKPGNPYFLG